MESIFLFCFRKQAVSIIYKWMTETTVVIWCCSANSSAMIDCKIGIQMGYGENITICYLVVRGIKQKQRKQ